MSPKALPRARIPQAFIEFSQLVRRSRLSRESIHSEVLPLHYTPLGLSQLSPLDHVLYKQDNTRKHLFSSLKMSYLYWSDALVPQEKPI